MRITQRISVFVTGVVICVLMASVGIVPAGSLDSPGAPGAAATVNVNATFTASPGTQASVTNIGTTAAALFDFIIPQGRTLEQVNQLDYSNYYNCRK